MQTILNKTAYIVGTHTKKKYTRKRVPYTLISCTETITMYIHTYIYTYVHTTCANIHTYIHMYTHLHTYIHTYTHRFLTKILQVAVLGERVRFKETKKVKELVDVVLHGLLNRKTEIQKKKESMN